MAITLNLENDELATLFFNIQLDDRAQNDPVMEKLILRMESLIYSRFSIDEIERYKDKVQNGRIMGEYS